MSRSKQFFYLHDKVYVGNLYTYQEKRVATKYLGNLNFRKLVFPIQKET